MDSTTPVAIIGLSCKFAGEADSPSALWKLCAEGKSAWSKIPSNRFNLDAFYHPNGQKLNTLNVQGGHFLQEDVAHFDANFFNFTSELAAAFDPQFRLQLEGTYEALESAGISLEDAAGSNTSVFAGSFFHDYNEMHIRDPDTLPRSLLVGSGSAMASNRLSHFFDLRGPSMTLDTGCSTTLTAFHQACQSLKSGEADMSIVGASNVILNPDNFMVMSSTFLSEAGRSFAFDSRASGYGRGEGSATVIIKRLDDALSNGDPIRAIVRATALNQDGKTETITTPSQDAQARLIAECYRRAGLDPAETTYFEAHGTGTPTGDPIEAGAVSSVFTKSRPADAPLLIGSVKTNIGHTETASGLASIIKVTLALESGLIPPSINLETPNPKIPFDEYRIKVPRELTDWPEHPSGIRRASVNNFGYGGSNAHVIMEDYRSYLKSQKSSSKPRIINGVASSVKPRSRLFLLSAKDETALKKMAENLKSHLQRRESSAVDEDKYLDDLAYTLGQRRTRLPWTAAHVAKSISGLIDGLTNKLAPSKTTEAPRVGFVFTGQGAQWWAMGRELIEAYPLFKASVLEAEGYLQELGSTWNLIEELNRSPEETRVNELAFSTPLCAVVQISLVRLLASWGVKPAAVTSHSSGEVAAAYAAGALSLRAAMAICYARGQTAGRTPPGVVNKRGGMIATGLGPEKLQPYIDRVKSAKVMVACLNSPSSTTASGDLEAVVELEELLKQDNVFARRLKIDAAYHSHHMQALAGPYLAWLEKLVKPTDTMQSDVIYSSPTTGQRETSGQMISAPQHWVNSFANPVRFVEAFRNMCLPDPSSEQTDVDIVVEIGPHAALSGPVQEIVSQPEFKDIKVTYLPSLVRKTDAVSSMHTLATALVQAGVPVNMNTVNFPRGRANLKTLPDLPSYPWNHQARHWSEPRLNKTHRHRVDSDHDLLGSLVLGTNMMAPTWRHTVRLSDLPWLRDHVVQTSVVYPGAGYICMAIEAARQVAKSGEKRVLGYHLRDIEVLLALQVPEEGVETQLSLSPSSPKAIHATGWTDFHVYSVDLDNNWTEHCRGQIRVDVAGDDSSAWSPPRSAELQLKESHEDSYYRKTLHPAEVYDAMHAVEVRHGPIFQNIESARASSTQSVFEMRVADTAATQPYKKESDHVVHPTTLDSLFQAAYAGYIALPDANMAASFVPKIIKGLHVSADICKTPGHRFKAYCDLITATSESFDADLVVIEQDAEKAVPLIKLDHYVVQNLGNVINTQPDAYDQLGVVQWSPDLSLASPEFLKERMTYILGAQEQEIVSDMRRLCIYFIDEAVRSLTVANVAKLKWHHKKFYVWMKLQLLLASKNKFAHDSATWLQDSSDAKVALMERVAFSSVNGEFVCRVGPMILPMLRHEILPEAVLEQESVLQRYQLHGLGRDRSHQQLRDFIELYTHKTPRAKILEIGGGSGIATKHILEAIKDDTSGDGPYAASYDFTDIEETVVESAAEDFRAWSSIFRAKILDIEKDPGTQSFDNGTYDLVISCQALTATKNTTRSLTNARKLLKPGGTLLLLETTHDRLEQSMVFGSLSNWWIGEEEERADGPSLPLDAWDRVLKDSGFSGVDNNFADCDDERFSSFNLMSSTAKGLSTSGPHVQTVLVTEGETAREEWLAGVQSTLTKVTGDVPVVASLGSFDPEGKTCIFFGDVEVSFLKDPTSAQFEAITALCTKSRGLLWLTQGGAAGGLNIDASLAQGFLRTLRTEYGGKRAILLDLDPAQGPWTERTAGALVSVFRKSFNYANDSVVKDFEYAERDGVIQIPRYYKDAARNATFFPDPTKQSETKLELFDQAHRPLRLAIGKPGMLDTLAFVDDLEAQEQLPTDFVRIRPQAFGVNFRDVMTAMGQLETDHMGFECSGVIEEVGAVASAQGFKCGDRVASLMTGHYANNVRVPWTNVTHIPDSLDSVTAASIPHSYSAAYVALFEIAKVQTNETVLIHAGSGGVGQAVVNLARHAGARVLVTVGSPEKKEFMVNKFGLESECIFSSRNDSFVDGVMAATSGKGADVVINTLSGSLLQKSFDCVAQFGRFVELGKKDFEQGSSMQTHNFAGNISFSSLDLLQLQEHKGEFVNAALRKVFDLLASGAILKHDPLEVYGLSEIERTFRLMQTGKHLGKMVVSVQGGEKVSVVQKPPTVTLRADASYLVIGGVGGIGKSVCQWLARHGAKQIIVVSRSARLDKIQPFVSDMAELGCAVHAVGCDIADATALFKALDGCAHELPPIRGVIQGAMVLQDSIMEQMTIGQWKTAIRPKVQGSWNLHEYFSQREHDFFVLLSSLSGVVGLASQCNYAAGGAYQDALANYRLAIGLPAASIDIGVVQAVGVVAENKDLAEGLRRSGYKALSEQQVLTVLGAAINTNPTSQMLVGLNGANWEASGLERDDRFTPMKARDNLNADGASQAGATELSSLIAAASTLDDAATVISQAIADKLTDLFMLNEDEVKLSKAPKDYGVDSLSAVELRNVLAVKAGAEISIFDIMQSQSITALAAKVASTSKYLSEDAATQ